MTRSHIAILAYLDCYCEAAQDTVVRRGGERNRKGKGSWSEDHCLDQGDSICRDTQENLSSFNSPAWPVKKVNMAVAPIAMAVPGMMQLQTEGTWCVVVEIIVKSFFSISLDPKDQNQLASLDTENNL